jgi:hypothetical protein
LDGISEETWFHCMSRQLAGCEPLNLPGSSLDDQRFGECLDRLESGTCALVRTVSNAYGMQVCADLGNLAEGQPCERFHQCASARCTDSICTGAPREAPLRETVYDVGETPDGTSCNNSYLELVDGSCQEAGSDLGGSCPCNLLLGLECMCGDEACSGGMYLRRDAPEGVCGPPPALALGDTCDTFGESFPAPGWCEPGTVCFNQGNGECVVANREGDACQSNVLGSSCEAGLVCAPPDGVSESLTCNRPCE